jgi:nitrate reductase delta subunit
MIQTTASPRLSLRVLAALLGYPNAALRAAAPEMADALDAEAVVPAARRDELRALVRDLQRGDPYEVEARFVETFDRGRATSLHLFEHVHGDSRERGPAMVDLLQTYERAGLHLDPGELPDHLAVMLEFASTQPPKVARAFLAEVAHILNAIFSALVARNSPYASVIAAVLELAGERPQSVALVPDEPLDTSWAEPPAFEGCSTRGQARPDAPQPIHIVRRNPAAQGATP